MSTRDRTPPDRRIEVTRIGARPVGPQASEHMVRMRDGVRLATDVYVPAGDPGPGPTVLIRLPYDKNGEYTFIPDIAAYFVRHGYRVVAQDVRGKFRSEGDTLLFVNEADDGHDTLEWVTHQEWSDGIVGMWGDSYYGFTQWAAVSTRHPALRAIVPRLTGTRLGEPARADPDGVTAEVELGHSLLYPLTWFFGRDTLQWDMDWQTLPYCDTIEALFATVGARSPSYDLYQPHPVPLPRFRNGHPFDAPPVPTLMCVGWWDNCAHWQWEDHEALQRIPAWAANEYLLIEAVDHENNNHFLRPWMPDLRTQGAEAPRQPELMARYLDPAIEFFDVFLRRQGRADDIPRVRWQHANTTPGFRVSPTWPPPGVQTRDWFPTDGAAALGDAPGGRLDPTPPAAPDSVSWTHDPARPVPSPVPDAFAFLAYNPDERALADRPDVLGFTSPALAAALDLAGPVTLSTCARSDGPELDLFARLLDVAPDGAAHLVARGQVTLRADVYGTTVTVRLGQVGYRVAIGHRLRLTLASSDAPEHVPAWGRGGDRWRQSERVANVQTLVLNGARPTRLRLPVLVEGLPTER